MKRTLNFNQFIHQRIDEFVNEYYGPDPRYEVDCMSEGRADFCLVLNAKKDANAVSGDEFNELISEIDAFCEKHFKGFSRRMISGLKIYNPLNPVDESWEDYLQNGDGTYNVGSLSWKFEFDFEDAECESHEAASYFSPSEKHVQSIVRKYKWIDPKKCWVEDLETEAEGNCD